MPSWGYWLSYLLAAVVGLLVGWIAGRRLGEIMQKHHILDTPDREYWRDVLGVMFACGGIAGGLSVAKLILG